MLARVPSTRATLDTTSIATGTHSSAQRKTGVHVDLTIGAGLTARPSRLPNGSPLAGWFGIREPGPKGGARFPRPPRGRLPRWLVRVDLADLECRDCGRGFATIDGVDQPISAGAARRMACTAGLIPAVFDGGSLPLDLGRRSRIFTKAQVLPLWERDDGCAFLPDHLRRGPPQPVVAA